MSNYKKKIAAVALTVAVAAGFAGMAASHVEDGAKANGLKVASAKANGL